MSGVTLRPWAYEDILPIAGLEKECFPDPWNFRMLADAFFSENTLTVAAEENGALIGYAFAVLAGEEADVANVAVAQACRRRGVAAALLGRLEDGARERGRAHAVSGSARFQRGGDGSVPETRIRRRICAQTLLRQRRGRAGHAQKTVIRGAPSDPL